MYSLNRPCCPWLNTNGISIISSLHDPYPTCCPQRRVDQPSRLPLLGCPELSWARGPEVSTGRAGGEWVAGRGGGCGSPGHSPPSPHVAPPCVTGAQAWDYKTQRDLDWVPVPTFWTASFPGACPRWTPRQPHLLSAHWPPSCTGHRGAIQGHPG